MGLVLLASLAKGERTNGQTWFFMYIDKAAIVAIEVNGQPCMNKSNCQANLNLTYLYIVGAIFRTIAGTIETCISTYNNSSSLFL